MVLGISAGIERDARLTDEMLFSLSCVSSRNVLGRQLMLGLDVYV